MEWLWEGEDTLAHGLKMLGDLLLRISTHCLHMTQDTGIICSSADSLFPVSWEGT